MLWFARQMPWPRLWYKLLIVGVVCGALAWPLLSTVRSTHKEMRFYHGPTLPMSWLQMLLPGTQQRFYHDLLGIEIREERGDLDPVVCFPGVMFSFLAAIGAWRALFGPAATKQDRIRRHAYRFCLAASILAVTLSLGMWIHLGPIRVPGPYALLLTTLSPFGSVRSVYRFYIFGHLFAAILAGLGLRQCLAAVSTARARRTIAVCVVVVMLVESIWVPLNLQEVGGRPSDVHPLYQHVAQADPNAPLIELPIPNDIKRAPLDALYTFSSIHTWQPLVNGYASYFPGLYEQLREVMSEFPSFRTIRYLQALGVQYVLVREGLMPTDTAKAVKRFPRLREVERVHRDVLYKVADSRRRSLNDWQGQLRFRIERDPKSDRVARGSVVFELDLREVIPVLPGDRATRWTVTWRDASNRVVKTRTATVRNSHWLTYEKNALRAQLELPDHAGTYTVEAVDQRDGRSLGSCSFEVK
jgi:hypothetical protein